MTHAARRKRRAFKSRQARERRQRERWLAMALHEYPHLPWWWRLLFWFHAADRELAMQEAVRCWRVLHTPS